MTTRSPRHDVLFEPLAIGPKTLRNRFYQVPHCTGFGTQKPLSQADFRAMKAEGGWAAVCTEYAPVSADSDSMPYVSARIWDDDDARNLAVMCEAVHGHGALVGIELHHEGMIADARESRWPSVGPSQIANALYPNGAAPKAMDIDDIRRVQRDWTAAAVRARDVGFDIVYVQGAHSALLAQFLSPKLNHRTDEYGGSLDNRARMWLETLEVVRRAVGGDCAVAVRIAVDALGPWGATIDDGLGFVELADHLVDLWDITVGATAGFDRLDSAASRFFGEGYELAWTRQVRAVTDKPIVGVGRFTNPDTMAELVRQRELDLIGAARPSIADPFLPKKIEEGRYTEIRECIGCNICYSRAEYGGHIGCTQNATAGEEYRRGWHPERFSQARATDKRVLVVGAGPAGLECAIVLAKRGYDRVHLIEKDSEVGGCVRWISRFPGLREWRKVLDWRLLQLDRLRANVEVITGRTLEAADVLSYGAELVVLATGSLWATDGFSGVSFEAITGADASQNFVLTPEQVMLENKRPPGEHVVVYDCEGYFTGASIAEFLRLDGYQVTIVTPHLEVAPLCNETLEGPRLRHRLHEIGIDTLTTASISSIDERGVCIRHQFGKATEVAANAAVLVTQRLSCAELYDALIGRNLKGAGIEGVYRIGDCVAPRVLADAIFDGHRLGREIDSGDPGTPLPYRRERLVAASARSESARSDRILGGVAKPAFQ